MLRRAKSFFIKRKKHEDELELPEAVHLRRQPSLKLTKGKKNNVIVLKSEELTTHRPPRYGDSFVKNTETVTINNHFSSLKVRVLDLQTVSADNEFVYESHRKSKSLERGINNYGKAVSSSKGDSNWLKEQVFIDDGVPVRGKDLFRMGKRSETWCNNNNNNRDEQLAKMKSKIIADELKTSPLFNNNDKKKNFKLEPTSTLKRFMKEYDN